MNARQLRVEFGESEQWTLVPLAMGAILATYPSTSVEGEKATSTVVQVQAQIAAEVIGRTRWGINE